MSKKESKQHNSYIFFLCFGWIQLPSFWGIHRIHYSMNEGIENKKKWIKTENMKLFSYDLKWNKNTELNVWLMKWYMKIVWN